MSDAVKSQALFNTMGKKTKMTKYEYTQFPADSDNMKDL